MLPLIDQLITADDSTPLSQADRAAILAALRELALAQSLIARQTLLLESFNSDQRAIETNLREAVADAANSAAAPLPDTAFDYTKSKAARDELTRRVNTATNLRDLLAAALTFVRAVA
ncbi:MAG: hypothetical protein ACKVZJ_15710 [Phycisphaerales bacterium]